MRTFAFKAFSMLVIFGLLISNTAVALAQQPEPGTPTAPAPSATPAAPSTPVTPAEATPTTAPTQAPTVFSISGKATDKDGLPLPGVSISDDHGDSTSTAADGSYALPGLKPGTYLVTPKLEGQTLIPYYRVVKLVDKDVSGVDFYVPKTNGNIVKAPTNQPAGSPSYVPHPPAKQQTQAANPPEGDLSGQAVYTVGEPGLVYRYDSQKGTTEEPYIIDASGAITHLNTPVGVAIDSAGNLLVAEERGSRLVRYNPSGASTLSIGKAGVRYTDDYVFSRLLGTTEKPDDHSIWVADYSRVVKYDSSGNFVLQFPADNPWETGSDNDHLYGARGIAFNTTGSEMYVTDTYNNRVQVFIFDGAGNPVYLRTIGETGVVGDDDSHFNNPWHLTFYDGSIYVADLWNVRIQKCDPTTATCMPFDLSGPAIDLRSLDLTASIAFGSVGSTTYAFIADSYNNRVLRCDVDGANCTHFAGTAGESGSDNDHFYWPEDITVGPGGKVYVDDKENHRVQVFDGSNGDWLARRGTTNVPYLTDGNHLNSPWGTTIAPDGSLYVAEHMGLTLVKYNASGVFQWRRGEPGVSGMGTFIWWSGEPEFNGTDVDHFSSVGIEGTIGVDQQGRIYVPDIANYRVVIYLPDGTVFDTIGNGWGSDNYHFDCPTGVAIRPDNGDIYVFDTGNQRIQVYDSQRHYKGTIGEPGISGSDSSHFGWAWGLAVDSSGNVYVADHDNYRVQKCRLNGSSYSCVPFAGVTGVGGPDFRYINGPMDVAIGPDGLVYIVEEWQNRVQVFDTNGAYRTTLGGDWGTGTGNLRNPSGVAVASNGDVYVTDKYNQRVVKYARGVPGWSQLNVNGWGESSNWINSVAEFNGKLYAGVTNTRSGQKVKIYRYNDDGTWTGVMINNFGESTDIGIDPLIAFNGYLYAGAFRDTIGTLIWRSSDGVTWTQVPLPDSFTSTNPEVYLFRVFQNALYVVPYGSSHGAELWRCTQASGCDSADDWQRVVENGFGTGTDNRFITAFAEFDGKLFVGTTVDPSVPGAQVWASPSGDANSWVKMVPDGFGDSHNQTVRSLEVFGDYLYVGTTNSNTGGQIWRCPVSTHCASWSEVVSDGFGDSDNTSIPILKEFNNKLYALTNNNNQGVQVFDTEDGTTWNPVIDGTLSGFGSNLRNNIYSPSNAVIHENRLVIGVVYTNLDVGGQVWASNPATYAISGTVTPSAALPGSITLDSMTLTLQPGGKTTTPDATTGNYSFSALANGSYTVTPSRSGCSFAPTTQTVPVSGGDAPGVNFSVTCTAVNLTAPADGTQLNSLLPLTLSWSALSGATKYNLVVSTSSTFASTFKNVTQAGTSYALSGMAAGATYYWRVKESAPVAGAWSVTWKFYAPKPPAAPAQLLPANNAVLAADNFRPVFTWKASTIPTGATPVQHYHLQVSRQSTFDSLDLDEYTLDASTSYTTPFDLTPNRVYYWRLRAFNTSGGYSAWSTVRSFKTLPGLVGLDGIQDQDTLRPTFHWHDDWNTGKYTIQVCKLSGSTCTLFKPATLTILSYSLTTSLAVNAVYQWRVQAVGTAGAGPWTSYWSWTTPNPPAVPALIWPADNAILPDTVHPGYRPTFDWTDVPGTGVYYQFQISTDAAFYDWSTSTYQPSPPSLSQFQPVDELLRNQTYWWRVRSCGSDNKCSVWAVRKLLTKPAVPDYDGEYSDDNTGVYGFYWTDDNQNSANKYTVQVCNNAACTSLFKSATVSDSWEYHLLLPSNKDMWWRVQGVGVATGGWMITQAFHTVTTPGVPVLVSPAANGVVSDSGDFDLTWKPVAGAEAYNIQMSGSSTFAWTDVDDDGVTDTYYEVWAYGTCYWRVRAQIGDYWGQWSAGRKFLTKPWVAGYVLDLDGNPIEDANVSLNPGGYNTTTDSDGTYWFDPNLSTGTKTLTVTAAGYLPMTRRLATVNGGDYFSTDFYLTPVNSTPNNYRFVLSWDPQIYRDLDLHAWLPAATPDHIFYENEGRLDSYPYTLLSSHDIYPKEEVMDIGPFLPSTGTGKYVVGVNQWYPSSTAWSTNNVKVEVYNQDTLVKTCPSPSGSGHWWYVMDVTVNGGTPTFTCKNKIQSAAPAPYSDNSISGTINQSNGRPLQGVNMNYGVGSMVVDSPFTLTGLGPGNYTLTPTKSGWSFSNPPMPVPTGTTDVNFIANPTFSTLGGDPAAVAVQGDYLYVGGGGKLYVVNVQDKFTPLGITAFWIAPDTITDVAVQGNYAYVTEGDSGLNILDISDPSNPQFVGLYTDANAGAFQSVAVSGDYAYLTTGHFLTIVDIRDPAKPRYVNYYYWDGNGANRVMVNGNYAYVVGDEGLWIFNITDPTKFSLASHWDSGSGNPAVDVIWHENYLILAESASLYVVNDDDPSHPYQVNSFDLPSEGAVYRITQVGEKLYVADGAKGLLVCDISQPWNDIPQLGAYVPSDPVTAVAALDTYAYIVNGANVGIVDASKPTPLPAGSYTPAP